MVSVYPDNKNEMVYIILTFLSSGFTIMPVLLN